MIFDVAVIGAGVFGSWIAYQLKRAGADVVLVDAYGPGNSRASSGGESRIIRMGYGPDEIYTHSAVRSFALWREFFERIEPSPPLFHKTGVLWVARSKDPYCEATLNVLHGAGVSIERLQIGELRNRYPQFHFDDQTWGILEHDSGAVMARRAVQALAHQTALDGTTIINEAVLTPDSDAHPNSIITSKGNRILAGKFVFACGPWLPKIFPKTLQGYIHVTRQEVFFFGTPGGDARFSPQLMPVWIDFNDLIYALPSLENRGFKLAIDAHGPEFDPDTGDRLVTDSNLLAVREYLKRRVPALSDAPITETRICQYENTSNGDFLIDRHPDFDNVWLVGGGSGHGFKHGPAVAEYVVKMLSGDGKVETRFELASKRREQQRAVY
ncbi:MAG TPA: FAD-dependent oxidoreductase [Pyrinomonadaceae bacterium]|jgi:monomeric sarcosine oxidase|nr:FAD-dependent oxidoreductase [Pyrinomonadaceae bacterium]